MQRDNIVSHFLDEVVDYVIQLIGAHLEAQQRGGLRRHQLEERTLCLGYVRGIEDPQANKSTKSTKRPLLLSIT